MNRLSKFQSLVVALFLAFFLIIVPQQTHGDIIEFRARGAAGEGLLEGNIDPPTGEPGTGGIGDTGITFNTDNNLLHVHLEWGSANGYVDLTQDVFNLHLHGPTPNSHQASWGQTAPLMIVLSQSTGFDPSRTSGGLNANYFLDAPEAEALLAGRTYLNVHLSSSDTGVLRGYLAPVPEPGSAAILVSLGVAIFFRRRRVSSDEI